MRARVIGAASSCIAMLVVVGAMAAEQPREVIPQPLLDSAGHVRDSAYTPAPLPAADRAYADIKGDQMKAMVNEVVAISRKSRDDGNKYWGRIAGTKYEAMTGDLLEAKFRKLGMVNIERPEFPLDPQWFALDWDMTASSGDTALKFSSLTPALGSKSTAPEGLEAEAIWVGLGTAGDFAGRDVRGKAVVIHTMLAPGEMGQSGVIEGAYKRAVDQGAAAVIGIWGYYDNMAVWQIMRSSPGPVWLNTGAEFPPSFFMGFEDGKKLRDLIAYGPVTLKMNVKTELRSNLKSASIYGTLPGTSDENILVMAHMDGWYDAALDNASGIAVMLAMAEHFAKIPRAQRRRNLIFIGTAGHHVGSPNAVYLRDKRQDLMSKTALMINCEHVSVTQTLNWQTRLRQSTAVSPRRWHVTGSQKLVDATLTAFRDFGVGVAGDMDPRATGEMGAIFRLRPSMQVIQSPELKHTDADVPEYIPATGLEAVGRAFSKVVDQANRLDMDALFPPKK